MYRKDALHREIITSFASELNPCAFTTDLAMNFIYMFQRDNYLE